MPAASYTASKPQLWMYRPSQSLQPIRAQPAWLRPKFLAATLRACKHPPHGSVSVSLFSLNMQSLGQSCLPTQSLWITQVERPIYASMIHTLWWGAIGGRWGAVALCRPSLRRSSVRLTWGGGLGHQRVRSFARLRDISLSGSMLQWGLCGDESSRKALLCFIWCLSLTRLLLLFTSNDKTACDCVCITCFIDVIQKLRSILKSIINILKRSLNQKENTSF